MNRCRFGWYEASRVYPRVHGQPLAAPKGTHSAEARLVNGPSGVRIVDAIIDGIRWTGRLMTKKPGMTAGTVLLYENPAPAGIDGE